MASFTKKCPRNHWVVESNRRHFFEELAQKLNIQKPSDWGNVSCETINKHSGGSLLPQFDFSIHAALRDAYPGNALPFSAQF